MVHDHSHKHQGQEHGQGNYNRAFAIGTALNIGFVIVEAVYGYRANSLALVADAGHNLSDVLGLLLAWGASALTLRPPVHSKSQWVIAWIEWQQHKDARLYIRLFQMYSILSPTLKHR